MRQSEELMSFLKGLKLDTVIFEDFNKETLVVSNSRNDYENLIYAFDFKQQNFQPIPLHHPLVWIISSQASQRKNRQSPQQLVILLEF